MSTDIEPATLDKDHRAPQNRFTTYQGLRSAYDEALRQHGKNDARFTSIRGIYDRLPPTDPKFLEQQGLGEMPNFNLGEFTSKVDSYVSTWVDHNTGGYKFATVRLKRKKENPPELSDYYDEKATEFFNEAITEWEDDSEVTSAAPYILESCIRDVQMGLFGIGVAYHCDDMDWRFKAIPTRKILVPRGTKITLTNCPVMFILTESTVTDIYNRVKASKDDGWNKEHVYRMLYDRTSETTAGSKEQFSDWQNRVRNNDDFLSADFSPVELVDCYVQEFNTSRKKDGISHYVISRSGNPMEILFKKDRRYKCYRDFLNPFSDNSGPEGDWHGVKGFGDQIYDNCDFQNRFFNDIAASSIISNMPMFTVNSEADRDKLAKVQWTKLGLLNPGLVPTQINIRTDTNGMLGVFNASQRMVNTNSRTYPAGESMGQEAKTATQSTFDRQDQAKLSTLQIKFYRMVGLDCLLSEMYRRLVKKGYLDTLPGGRAAKSFREKCKDAGIPDDCYTKPIAVQADRTGGTGNMALDLMKAKELFGIASPGRGQLNARREIAKAIIQSGDRVEEFVQNEELPSDLQGYVDLENSQLADGQSFPARPQQDHNIHLGTVSPDGQGHFSVLISAYQVASGMAKAGGIEQNLDDAKKLDRTLEATLTHVAEHVQFLGQFNIKQYQEAAKEMGKTLNDVGQFLQTFRQQIGAAMESQQQNSQPQMTPEMVQAMIETQARMQWKDQEHQQMLAQKQEAHQLKMGQTAEKTSVKSEIQLTEAQQKAAQRQQEFDQKMGISATEAMVNMEAERAKTRAKANVDSVSE